MAAAAAFFAGLLLGGTVGVFVMCLCFVSSAEDRNTGRVRTETEKREGKMTENKNDQRKENRTV